MNEESEGATARPRARRAVTDGGWAAARATALGGTGPSPTRDSQALPGNGTATILVQIVLYQRYL